MNAVIEDKTVAEYTNKETLDKISEFAHLVVNKLIVSEHITGLLPKPTDEESILQTRDLTDRVLENRLRNRFGV